MMAESRMPQRGRGSNGGDKEFSRFGTPTIPLTLQQVQMNNHSDEESSRFDTPTMPITLQQVQRNNNSDEESSRLGTPTMPLTLQQVRTNNDNDEESSLSDISTMPITLQQVPTNNDSDEESSRSDMSTISITLQQVRTNNDNDEESSRSDITITLQLDRTNNDSDEESSRSDILTMPIPLQTVRTNNDSDEESSRSDISTMPITLQKVPTNNDSDEESSRSGTPMSFILQQGPMNNDSNEEPSCSGTPRMSFNLQQGQMNNDRDEEFSRSGTSAIFQQGLMSNDSNEESSSLNFSASSNLIKPTCCRMHAALDWLTYKISKLFLCVFCGDLVTPPIFQCITGHILCLPCRGGLEKCVICGTLEINIHNKSMEKVALNMVFPCNYMVQGCKVSLWLNEKANHEKTCIFRGNIASLSDQLKEEQFKIVNSSTRFLGEPLRPALKPMTLSTSNLNDDLVALFKCDTCKEIIKTPFKQCKGGHIACSRCNPQALHCLTCGALGLQVRNVVMEQVANNLMFPCKHKERGCPLYLKFQESFAHEKKCQFNASCCPDYLKIRDTTLGQQQRREDEDRHEASSSSSAPTNVSAQIRQPSDDTKILIHKLVALFKCIICKEIVVPPILQCYTGHLFCYQCRSQFSSCLACGANIEGDVRNMALQKVANNLVFSCKYMESGCVLSFGINEKVEHEEKCEFREKNFPTPMEDIEEQVISATQLKTLLDFGTLTSRLVTLFECNVCLKFLQPPIMQCVNGHLVCSKCHPQLLCCHTPNILRYVHNKLMEEVATNLMFPCKYRLAGCQAFLLLNQKAEHDGVCTFRPYKCPIKEKSCFWQGQLKDVLVHIGHSHPTVKSVINNIAYLLINKIQKNRRTWLHLIQCCFGHHFLLILQGHETSSEYGKIFGSVQLIGTREQAEQFTYRLEFSCDRRRLVWEATVRSSQEDMPPTFLSPDCVVFDPSLLETLDNNNTITTKVIISKV